MKDQQTEGASQRHRHANKGGKVVSQPHRHGDSAQKSAYGIAQVEGGLDAAATQHFATLGMLHDQKLLGDPMPKRQTQQTNISTTETQPMGARKKVSRRAAAAKNWR